MSIVDITWRELGGPDWQMWQEAKRVERPDLGGGCVCAAGPHNDLIVDDHAYGVLLGDLCDRWGYAPPDPGVADSVRRLSTAKV